jgi:hypothetical protein
MAYGMAGRSPKLAGGVKAQPDNLERLSPGVYRTPQGNLVNAQGGRLPSARPEQPQQPQMPMQSQPMGSPNAMRPTLGNMPQMGGMMQPPMGQGYSPFMNYLAQQPQDVQNKFAELMANRPTSFNTDQFKMMLPYTNPGVAAGLGNALVNTGYFTQPGQRLPMAPDATIRPAVMPNLTMPNFTMPTFNK